MDELEYQQRLIDTTVSKAFGAVRSRLGVQLEESHALKRELEKQSEELVRYLMQDFENDPIKIWESDIFGRSLHSIVREGIQGKIAMMPDNARYKLQETLGRIINEGSGGLIAIIL